MNQDDRASDSYGLPPPGFRLPDETRVGTVHLQVSDLGNSIAYYQQVLGLRVQSSSAASATLGADGEDPPILALQTSPGVRRARRGALGLYHVAILLPERAALGRFAMHLSELGTRVGTADHLVSEAFYLSDPDGLGIEVYADRPRSAWRQRGRELIMVTDPLDVGDLVAASGGRPWNGMPGGTRVGHVHLHVGNLEEAERFYHLALGLDKMVWSYPGARFLGAGGYHHHLGTNVWSAETPAREEEARLVEWELLVPTTDAAAAAANSLAAAGYAIEDSGTEVRVADPWGTPLRIRVSESARDPR